MNTPLLPSDYITWRHCIEVDCGQQLDRAYIRQRIGELENPANFHTQQFVRRWGEPHRQRVVAWFQQAAQDLDAGARR